VYVFGMLKCTVGSEGKRGLSDKTSRKRTQWGRLKKHRSSRDILGEMPGPNRNVEGQEVKGGKRPVYGRRLRQFAQHEHRRTTLKGSRKPFFSENVSKRPYRRSDKIRTTTRGEKKNRG